jgi:hypothetical protein
MLTSFALSRISAWRTLSKPQRAFVWQQFIHPLTSSRKARNVMMLLALVLILATAWLGAFDHLYITIPILPALVFLPSELVELYVVQINKQSISSFIETHRKEIEATA